MKRFDGGESSQPPSAQAISPTQAAESATHSVPKPASAPKPPPAYLSVKAICELLDIGESTFHRIRNEEWMPRPIVLSPQVLRWSRVEVEEAMRQRAPRADVGSIPEPARLAQAGKVRRYRSGELQ